MAVGYEGELQLSQFEIMGTEYRFQNYHGYIRIWFQLNECAPPALCHALLPWRNFDFVVLRRRRRLHQFPKPIKGETICVGQGA